MIRGTGKTIARYDRRAEKVRAEGANLQHGLRPAPLATVRAGTEQRESPPIYLSCEIIIIIIGIHLRLPRRTAARMTPPPAMPHGLAGRLLR